ncbi:zinc ribbon domain-containing protein [candidate division KSB1 bacterium]|nr:zinc ribbon domain-containing protein [candidate division KSB1 bacterium]
MPIYEYRCKKCNHIFEVFQRINEDSSKLQCPVCKEVGPEKIFSAFSSSGSGGNSLASYSGSSGCGGSGFT